MASFAQAGAGLPPQPAKIPPADVVPIGKIFPDRGASTTPSQPGTLEWRKRATNLASWFIIISGGVVSAEDALAIVKSPPPATVLVGLYLKSI